MLARDSNQAQVIRLASHGSERTEDLASTLGVFDHLQKPVDSPHGYIVNRTERRMDLWTESQRLQETL
jgi:hypothetical protein